MKRKARLIEDKGSDRQDNSGLWSQEFHNLNSSAPYFCYASVPNVPYFDIRIYRESRIKSLIKAQSKDMYRLLEKVNFDGKYYRVKCVNSGEWGMLLGSGSQNSVFRENSGDGSLSQTSGFTERKKGCLQVRNSG